jgi:RNA polymerase sigma-70 factor (ECF subfamily)
VTETEQAAELALAQRSRRGDREAFEELVRRTGRAVFARLYLETADAHKAEDLAQETYLSAWRAIRGLSDPSAFRPWLYSIAHSALLDSLRRESRKKRSAGMVNGEALEAVAHDGPSPAQSAEGRERRQRVLAALRSMPQEYRLPLVMRYLGSADYETIGRELAITNGSLRGLLARGMAMLRERLKREHLD